LLVTNTSALSRIRSTSSRPSGRLTSRATLRLPRLRKSKPGERCSFEPDSAPKSPRMGSPDGASTLMTSAPQSASSPPAAGPAIHSPISTTRTPSSTPMTNPFSVPEEDRLALLHEGARPFLGIGGLGVGDRALRFDGERLGQRAPVRADDGLLRLGQGHRRPAR